MGLTPKMLLTRQTVNPICFDNKATINASRAPMAAARGIWWHQFLRKREIVGTWPCTWPTTRRSVPLVDDADGF